MKTHTDNRFWMAGGISLVLGALFAFFEPLTWPVFPRCVLHSLTGWYCPGCGTGRALTQLAHGHWLTALRLNPVTLLGLPLLGLLWVTGRLDRVRPVWIWTMLAVLVTFGVLRNLPWPPFNWLAP